MTSAADTKAAILGAAKHVLRESGFAGLSTRLIAESAGVPLSQIHYHFGSRQKLVLELLETENQRLLERQREMYGREMPLWERWEQACDFLEDDLTSGYVRVLQEMTAAGWSDGEIAAAVRRILRAWFELLADTAALASDRIGGLGPFAPMEIAALAGMPFLGAEALILLGFEETDLPARSALRKVGALLRALEDER